MKPQMDERWRRKGASTVEYIVVLAAVFILAMAVYHALSGDEMAGMIMEKIQAAIDGDLTGGGASPGTGGGSPTEETDTKQSPSPKGDSPPPPEKDDNPALQFAKGAGDVALDFIGFYDAKAAITGVDENGNKIGWGERIFRGALVVPIAKPVKGGKMALKYGDKALTAGKKNLDKLTRKGKKTACGCPRIEIKVKKTQGSGKELIREIEAGGYSFQVKSGHAYNRPHATGSVQSFGSMDEIEQAIVDDIVSQTKSGYQFSLKRPEKNKHAVMINGNKVGYDVIWLGDRFSISTYYPKK